MAELTEAQITEAFAPLEETPPPAVPLVVPPRPATSTAAFRAGGHLPGRERVDLTARYIASWEDRQAAELERWLQETMRPPALTMQQQAEQLVEELAPQYGLDPLLVKNMIQAESAWNPRATSPKGAMGLAQLMPATARRFGVRDPYDPAQAIPGMLAYLKVLTEEFGDPSLVVAAYNAGEGAVRHYGTVPPYQETVHYVRRVFGGTEAQPYTSRGQRMSREREDLTARAQQALQVPTTPPAVPPAPSLLDTTLPSLTPETITALEAQGPPTPYTSKAAEVIQTPQSTLEAPLEEPLWQRTPLRVMQGVLSTAASIAALPITGAQLLGVSRREAEQLLPVSAGAQTGLADVAKTFDPTGSEENIIDRFAQTLGQQAVFFGSGALVRGGVAALESVAPTLATWLGATTATIQEAGQEAQDALTQLTPFLGEAGAAERANTVFWRNLMVIGLTNRLGVFSQVPASTLFKVSTAAAMEGFQEVAQYDVQRRELWVDARHPVAAQLQAVGWKRHAQRVYQPFDVTTAAEAGALGAIIGGLGHVVVNAAGQQVLPLATEAQAQAGLRRLEQVTARLAQDVPRVAPPTAAAFPPADVAAVEPFASLAPAPGQLPLRQPAPSGLDAPIPPLPQPQVERRAPTPTPDLAAIRQRVRELEASQVRDEEGRLIRVYHGTPATFAQFATTSAQEGGLAGVGLYFTDDPEVASDYSRSKPFPGAERAPQVRPAYLDMRHPYVATTPVALSQADLQAQGYDGVIRDAGGIAGVRPHREYVVFSPAQVIPAFELEAHPWFRSVLAYADWALAQDQPEAPTVPPTIGTGVGLLRGQGGALFPQQPSPPARRPLTMRQAATGLERGQFQDAQGRWRLPLRDMPSAELELQDFIRQQGGMRLAGEALQGELRALISRRETGTTGLHNDVSGISLQQMAEKAHELGFTPTPDTYSLLEALDRSVTQGQMVFSTYSTGHIPLLHNPQLMQVYQDVVTLADTLEAQTQAQRRGVRPRAQVRAEGEALIESGQWTLDDVRELLPGTVLNDEMASALVQLLGHTAASTAEVARAFVHRVEAGQTAPGAGSQEEQSWLTAFGALASTHPQRLGAIAEAGRSLGILNDPLSATNRMLTGIGTLASQAPEFNSYTLAQKYLTLLAQAGGKQAVQFAQQAVEPSLGNMLLELYYQNLLSNPRTWVTNMVSNATTAAYALPVRLMSGLYSQTFGSGEVALTETAAMIYGMTRFWQQAWQRAARAFRTGEATFGADIPGVLEPVGTAKGRTPAITAANVQALTARTFAGLSRAMDPASPLGMALDFWANWVGLASGGRLGQRVMESTDEWFKFLNYGAELGALAYRKAVQAHTIDPASSFTATMTEVLTQPLPEEIHQAATQHALVQTFQNALMPGGIAERLSHIQQLSINVPGFGDFPLGRIIVPFLHVSANIPRYALENSPLGIFFKSVRDDVNAGGARGDLAMGKILTGSLTAMTMAVLAAQGLITGRGPEDPALREALRRTGWQPYSAWLPWGGEQGEGSYISLRAFDPIVAQHAGIVADIIETWSDQRIDAVERVVLGPIYATASGIGTRSYMRGMAGFFDAFAPRSMREFTGETTMSGLRGWLRQTIASGAPSLWTAAEKLTDPATKLAWDAVDGFRQKTPGWMPLPAGATAATLANARNKWGEKRLMGYGWASEWLGWVEGFTTALTPLQVSAALTDPLDKILVRDTIRLGMPTRTLGLPGLRDVEGAGAEAALTSATMADPYQVKPVPLTPHQYERLVVLAANNAQAQQELGLRVHPDAVRALRRRVSDLTETRLPESVGADLYAVLLWATSTPLYQHGTIGPQGTREDLLQQIDSAYRAFGRQQLLANDAVLRQQFLTARALQEWQRTPVGKREQARPHLQRELREEERRLTVGAPR